MSTWNVETLGSGFSHPYGICVDSSGRILVTDSSATIKRMAEIIATYGKKTAAMMSLH